MHLFQHLVDVAFDDDAQCFFQNSASIPAFPPTFNGKPIAGK
jgi:hypothetical protein